MKIDIKVHTPRVIDSYSSNVHNPKPLCILIFQNLRTHILALAVPPHAHFFSCYHISCHTHYLSLRTCIYMHMHGFECIHV